MTTFINTKTISLLNQAIGRLQAEKEIAENESGSAEKAINRALAGQAAHELGNQINVLSDAADILNGLEY